MNYAYVQEGRVMEVIAPMLDDSGNEIPIEARFTEEFRQSLVPCDDSVKEGLVYDGTTFSEYVPPPKSAAQILADNTAARDTMLAQATAAIAPLQDAVDLDEATDAEIALLNKWKQYRVAVNRVDLTQASPVWPAAPSA
ncbi:tail fiber assembly protein [Caballeronia sp. LZ062]|uniref:tail fiber assembly protein n=1 Tax=unclassified Caballeronia TaxID=2646786 RepID=UPI00286411CE|nr:MULTISPECIES: tail fiber assembly protein [unclassified Caballeronia]MDR5857249.1 tail fiber assembly protein [Caballeronia sp. LZ050]MDR5868800.1 tail fiber assembly protein [Caballeronia sp. LZ062]